jgi:hypothetical protein
MLWNTSKVPSLVTVIPIILFLLIMNYIVSISGVCQPVESRKINGVPFRINPYCQTAEGTLFLSYQRQVLVSLINKKIKFCFFLSVKTISLFPFIK